jgi:general secretion pathway protein G
MHFKSRQAFTMLELVFVVAIIGILSAVAIPRFAATRDDAVISKAKATVSSVRNAMATERQKRVLKGTFGSISSLHSGSTLIFNAFDGNTSTPVLEYPPLKCASGAQGCWQVVAGSPPQYQYVMPVSGTVDFNISNNRFDCDISDSNCRLLTQ